MKYYNSKNESLITTEELIKKYGTEQFIPMLGIYPLSIQPDYTPISFNDLGDGTWYPVESYDSMKEKAVEALMETGMSEEEARETLQ